MLNLTTESELATFERGQFVLKDITDSLLGQITDWMLEKGEPLFEAYRVRPTIATHLEYLLQGIEIPVQATVVDVGCGVGTVTRLLQRWRPDLRCLNLNLSEAQLRYCPNGIVADGHSLPLASQSADVVLMLYVLGYGLLESFLREAHRVTKSGGWICIYDVLSDTPQTFLGMTGYASHQPPRVVEVAHAVGWTMTAELVTEAYPSPTMTRLMGTDFQRLFGDCHSVIYRGRKD